MPCQQLSAYEAVGHDSHLKGDSAWSQEVAAAGAP